MVQRFDSADCSVEGVLTVALTVKRGGVHALWHSFRVPEAL